MVRAVTSLGRVVDLITVAAPPRPMAPPSLTTIEEPAAAGRIRQLRRLGWPPNAIAAQTGQPIETVCAVLAIPVEPRWRTE
ncbi:MAG: hypothetical protein R8L07_03625 [Alphaproteobacteria bacterium]|nr:hypothetical protein [Alphaproteobacteria bacterium]